VALDPSLLLFVSADRPHLYSRELASEASGAILDLQNAVSPDRMAFMRDQVRAFLGMRADRSRVVVRINPVDSPDGRTDLAMLAASALVIPKVVGEGDLVPVGRSVGKGPLIAIIETTIGVAHCKMIAEAPSLLALAFDRYNLAAGIDCKAAFGTIPRSRCR
jgi:citrate lyase subunit beta/citryl-CoA lyase